MSYQNHNDHQAILHILSNTFYQSKYFVLSQSVIIREGGVLQWLPGCVPTCYALSCSIKNSECRTLKTTDRVHRRDTKQIQK